MGSKFLIGPTIGVEQKPAVYLVYWGPQWAQGFMTADTNGKLYSSKTLQTYLDSFFTNVGGSGWANVQTQYCNGVLAGSTSCVGGTGFITNPLHQLEGVWTDPTPVPCGYHTQTTSVDGVGNPYRIQDAFIPWLNTNWPGVGTAGCGMHNVNATSDAFGNGIFDGWTIVTGHEYAEAVTDPDNVASNQDGWNDAQGNENGDKCAWMNTQNISLGDHAFAVQPLWSNEAFDATGNGCAVER